MSFIFFRSIWWVIYLSHLCQKETTQQVGIELKTKTNFGYLSSDTKLNKFGKWMILLFTTLQYFSLFPSYILPIFQVCFCLFVFCNRGDTIQYTVSRWAPTFKEAWPNPYATGVPNSLAGVTVIISTMSTDGLTVLATG